jgi:FkbM family methyltransferase
MFSRLCFNVARMYTMRFPRGRGVSRLMKLVQSRILPHLPEERIVVRAADGRQFRLPLHETATFGLMMTGLRDPRETALLEAILEHGDVAVDAGANCGWYTTLMARLVGSTGRVHAFEPVPATYAGLNENCAASGVAERVLANHCALGDTETTATIFVPKRHSAASLRPWGDQEMAEIECSVIPLDKYCREQGVSTIKLIKCDVEGSELNVLKGAQQVLAGDQRPMWLIEMNRLKSSLFNYQPEDLLEHLRGYDYVAHELSWRPLGRPVPMRPLEELAHAENVLCSVPDIHGDVGRYCTT